MYDAHFHLQDARFDACRDAVLAAAVAAGVRGGCCCGCEPGDWEAVAALAEQSRLRRSDVGGSTPDVRHAPFSLLPAFGVHPWHAGGLPADWLAWLEAVLLRHPEAPVGEIGIDGLRAEPPREAQRLVCIRQLELAVRLHRPVVLHGARAWGELVAVVKPFAPRLPGFVAHAFAGSLETLRELAALGGCVSFAGSVCNPAARRVRAAAAAAPAERLLLETDAPDMRPEGTSTAAGAQRPEDAHRQGWAAVPSELNQPANLGYVARAVAATRGMEADEVAARTEANARRVYGLT